MNDLYGPLDEKRKKRKKAGTESSKESSLRDWFGRKGAKGKKKGWVDCNAPDGKGGYKSCGRSGGEKRKKYPACRPTPGACKERGKGKSWGKKAKSKKSRKNEEISMELEQIILEELEAVLNEKKKRKKKKKKKKAKRDACYHKVKSRYKVWPSAYASGALVKCRKVGAKNWGNSKKEHIQIMIEDELTQVLFESHSKEHEEELKTIVGELEKASDMHASQAERIQQILDETDDDKLEEEKLDERCQKGYKTHPKRKTKKMYGKTYRNCIKAEGVEKEEELIEEIEEENVSEGKKNCGCGQDPCETYGSGGKIEVTIQEEIENFLEESLYYGLIDEEEELNEAKKKKKKKKACKPSKGKKFARRVKGKCVSYGQAGKAKGGGARIKPGTSKGNAYCARSYGDMKSHGKDCSGKDRGTPLCLSRQKWKCSGKYSRKGKK